MKSFPPPPISYVENVPYVFTVKNNGADQIVNLFGGRYVEVDNNFGNSKDIEFSYDIFTWYGGGTKGYAAMILNSVANEMSIDKIGIKSENLEQLCAPFIIEEKETDGSSSGSVFLPPLLRLTKVEKEDNCIERDIKFKLNGGTSIQYMHYANTKIKFFLFPVVESQEKFVSVLKN